MFTQLKCNDLRYSNCFCKTTNRGRPGLAEWYKGAWYPNMLASFHPGVFATLESNLLRRSVVVENNLVYII